MDEIYDVVEEYILLEGTLRFSPHSWIFYSAIKVRTFVFVIYTTMLMSGSDN